MKYRTIKKGIFQDRPNRFIAHVWIDGTLETVHVKILDDAKNSYCLVLLLS